MTTTQPSRAEQAMRLALAVAVEATNNNQCGEHETLAREALRTFLHAWVEEKSEAAAQDIESKVAELMEAVGKISGAEFAGGVMCGCDDMQGRNVQRALADGMRRTLESALRTALSSSAQVPDGMRLVPVEPPEAIYGKLLDIERSEPEDGETYRQWAHRIYAAVLAVAPSTPPKEQT